MPKNKQGEQRRKGLNRRMGKRPSREDEPTGTIGETTPGTRQGRRQDSERPISIPHRSATGRSQGRAEQAGESRTNRTGGPRSGHPRSSPKVV